jgi:hypothetical protein
MKTSIINGSEVSRLSVAIHTDWSDAAPTKSGSCCFTNSIMLKLMMAPVI